MNSSQTTTMAEAQRDMRLAYLGGGPGMLISAMVWLSAGIVCLQLSADQAIWTLFIGGMLIHPVSVLLVKALGRSGKHQADNPLAALAMATTFWMLLLLPLAYIASTVRMEWFFPAMLFIIGGRYLCFSTLFGKGIFWICGFALVLVGYALTVANAAPAWGAFAGAFIEAAFAIIIMRTARGERAG